MSHNAYALFFAIVLIGCTRALYRLFLRHRAEILAVCRGDLPPHLEVPERRWHFRIRPGKRLLMPVAFSICRI